MAPDFFALARNRNFLDRDGELSLDVGGFVAALEYAGAGGMCIRQTVAEFFPSAVEALGLARAEMSMIGDDAGGRYRRRERAGPLGALVRSGKYPDGREKTR